MLKKLFPFILAAVTVMAGCSANEQPAPVDQPNDSINEQEQQDMEVVMENLEVPWSIEKLGDTFYLTERAGHIVKIEDEQMERQEIDLKKTLSTAAEAGLLGFVLAPDFSESKKAFAYYTYEDDAGQFNRVVTLRLEDGIWREEELLLDQIPSGAYHHGGRLKIGPDEKL
ncbi:MAG: PQQ-dependent sugar dehydrogenase, partial [Lysinibacillus sp.]